MRHWKTISLALALSMTAHMANAADAVDQIPVPAAQPQAVALPVDMWSGAYGGVFGGYSNGSFDTSAGDIDADGFEGGAFIGFNQQIGSIVYGAEADLGYSGANGTLSGSTIDADKELFGSLRGRVGYTFDPVLIYGTAGLAVTQAEVDNGTASDSNTHLGWTVGAGADVAVTQNIFARGEYRYSDYESKNYNLSGTNVSSGFDEHTIRAGIGLKF